MKTHEDFLKEALKLAETNKLNGGRPFGAVLVKDGEIVSTGVNRMFITCDPSSHAEMEAIRYACTGQGQLTLEGYTIYASGHPCPMCLAVILSTRIEVVYYAFDNADASPYGLSSELTYQKLGIQIDKVPLKLIKLDLGVKASDFYGK